MSRRTVVYFGAGELAPAQVFHPRPVFPDLDTAGKSRNDSRTVRGRCLALAPETDWDHLIAYVNGAENEPVHLTPGVLYTHFELIQQVRVALPCLAPATRLYAARGEDVAGRIPPALAHQWYVNTDAGYAIKLSAANPAPVVWYAWDGAGWVAQAPLAPGASTGYFGTNAAVNRAADASPDGVYSFADYLAAGAIRGGPIDGPYNQPLYVSRFALDGNGNAGDPTNPTTKLYVSAFGGSISPLWYGCAALEVWDSEPCGYRPRLPAERIVELGPTAVPASPTPGTPNTPLLTVPALNVDRAQLTFAADPTAAAGLWAALGSPLAGMPLSSLAWVTSTPDQAPAGQDAAVAVLENVHGLVQVQLGSNDVALTSKLLRASLVLQRKVTG